MTIKSPRTTSIRIHSSLPLKLLQNEKVFLVRFDNWGSDLGWDLLSHIKISGPINNESNFLIGMQMFGEKVFQLVLIVWQTFFRASYLQKSQLNLLLLNCVLHKSNFHSNLIFIRISTLLANLV